MSTSRSAIPGSSTCPNRPGGVGRPRPVPVAGRRAVADPRAREEARGLVRKHARKHSVEGAAGRSGRWCATTPRGVQGDRATDAGCGKPHPAGARATRTLEAGWAKDGSIHERPDRAESGLTVWTFPSARPPRATPGHWPAVGTTGPRTSTRCTCPRHPARSMNRPGFTQDVVRPQRGAVASGFNGSWSRTRWVGRRQLTSGAAHGCTSGPIRRWPARPGASWSRRDGGGR